MASWLRPESEQTQAFPENSTTLNLALKLASCIVLLIATFGIRADTGPGTSTPPDLTGTASGVEFTSILTVGDAVK